MFFGTWAPLLVSMQLALLVQFWVTETDPGSVFQYFLDKAIKFLLLSLTIHICALQVHIGWHARWVECPSLMALLIRHPQCIMVVPLCISIGLGKFIGPAGVSSILIRLQNKATQIAVSSQFFEAYLSRFSFVCLVSLPCIYWVLLGCNQSLLHKSPLTPLTAPERKKGGRCHTTISRADGSRYLWCSMTSVQTSRLSFVSLIDTHTRQGVQLVGWGCQAAPFRVEVPVNLSQGALKPQPNPPSPFDCHRFGISQLQLPQLLCSIRP